MHTLSTGNQFVVLSGCSGGGKSSLLEELRMRGYQAVEEPGRRIVQAELEGDGRALPWINLEAFARRAIEMAHDDLRRAAETPGWFFFDRGLVDACVALRHATNEALPANLGTCYHRKVFLVPPWEEIYLSDFERQHTFVDAVSEFERLNAAYQTLGYTVIVLPKTSVSLRADFVIETLQSREIEGNQSL